MTWFRRPDHAVRPPEHAGALASARPPTDTPSSELVSIRPPDSSPRDLAAGDRLHAIQVGLRHRLQPSVMTVRLRTRPIRRAHDEG